LKIGRDSDAMHAERLKSVTSQTVKKDFRQFEAPDACSAERHGLQFLSAVRQLVVVAKKPNEMIVVRRMGTVGLELVMEGRRRARSS
jgi:hypothetical protein